MLSKVFRFHRHGGPEELRMELLDVGEPGRAQVRLRVEAIGLNRSEACSALATTLYCQSYPSYRRQGRADYLRSRRRT